MEKPGDEWWLIEAKEWLQERLKEGTDCPCCGRYARQYHRKLNRGMAISLINMYREAGVEWQIVHLSRHREETKLQHWELTQHGSERGLMRVTALGAAWLRGTIRVSSHIDEFNGKRLWIGGEQVSVSDVLKEPFDFDELMRGE